MLDLDFPLAYDILLDTEIKSFDELPNPTCLGSTDEDNFSRYSAAQDDAENDMDFLNEDKFSHDSHEEPQAQVKKQTSTTQAMQSMDSNGHPTVILPSGASVQIIGQLHHPHNSSQRVSSSPKEGSQSSPTESPKHHKLTQKRKSSSSSKKKTSSSSLKRKRSEIDDSKMTPEEAKKAAKRQRNRILAQQSRERKKRYVENLEKENRELKESTQSMHEQIASFEERQEQLQEVAILSTKKRVVLCMLICVALLVASQQSEDIPSRLAEVDMPAELPNDMSKVDLVAELYSNSRSELEKELSLSLPASILKQVVKDAMENASEAELSAAALNRVVGEISYAMKEKDVSTKDIKNTSRTKPQSMEILNHQNCDSEDSDEDPAV